MAVLKKNTTRMRLLLNLFAGIVFTNALVIFLSFNWPLMFRCEQCKAHRKIISLKGNSTNTFGNDLESSSSKFERVVVAVAVLTHPKRRPRRDAIRATWMSGCKDKATEMVCKFFTDGVGLENRTAQALHKEQIENQDLIFVPIPGGFAFAERLLWIWEWISVRFTYKYFLRIDDDHFLCVDHLLHELPHRPREALYWGFIHCRPNVVRVDEAWLMLTADLVEEILEAKRNSTLLCHPYGDQAVAMWITASSKNVTYFMDNDRIVHKSAGRDASYLRGDICERFLSLHGSYPTAMYRFWLLLKLRRRQRTPYLHRVNDIEPFSKLCSFSPRFDYKGFIPEYQFQPKLCSERPKWRISDKAHIGREEEGERYSKY